MAKVTSEIQELMRSKSKEPVALIVRVRDDLEQRATECRTLGFEVKRKLTLVQGLALRGPGTKIEVLAAQKWVVSIERDRPVRTQ